MACSVLGYSKNHTIYSKDDDLNRIGISNSKNNSIFKYRFEAHKPFYDKIKLSTEAGCSEEIKSELKKLGFNNQLSSKNVYKALRKDNRIGLVNLTEKDIKEKVAKGVIVLPGFVKDKKNGKKKCSPGLIPVKVSIFSKDPKKSDIKIDEDSILLHHATNMENIKSILETSIEARKHKKLYIGAQGISSGAYIYIIRTSNKKDKKDIDKKAILVLVLVGTQKKDKIDKIKLEKPVKHGRFQKDVNVRNSIYEQLSEEDKVAVGEMFAFFRILNKDTTTPNNTEFNSIFEIPESSIIDYDCITMMFEDIPKDEVLEESGKASKEIFDPEYILVYEFIDGSELLNEEQFEKLAKGQNSINKRIETVQERIRNTFKDDTIFFNYSKIPFNIRSTLSSAKSFLENNNTERDNSIEEYLDIIKNFFKKDSINNNKRKNDDDDNNLGVKRLKRPRPVVDDDDDDVEDDDIDDDDNDDDLGNNINNKNDNSNSKKR